MQLWSDFAQIEPCWQEPWVAKVTWTHGHDINVIKGPCWDTSCRPKRLRPHVAHFCSTDTLSIKMVPTFRHRHHDFLLRD